MSAYEKSESTCYTVWEELSAALKQRRTHSALLFSAFHSPALLDPNLEDSTNKSLKPFALLAQYCAVLRIIPETVEALPNL